MGADRTGYGEERGGGEVAAIVMCATVSQGITKSIDEQAYFNLIWQPSVKENPTIFARTAVRALSVWQMNNLKGCSAPSLFSAHSLCHIISAWLTLKFAFELSWAERSWGASASLPPSLCSFWWPQNVLPPFAFAVTKVFSLVSLRKCVRGVGVCVWVNFAIFAHGLLGTIKIILVSGTQAWTRCGSLGLFLWLSRLIGMDCVPSQRGNI